MEGNTATAAAAAGAAGAGAAIAARMTLCGLCRVTGVPEREDASSGKKAYLPLRL